MCVCVCVCDRERERKKERARETRAQNFDTQGLRFLATVYSYNLSLQGDVKCTPIITDNMDKHNVINQHNSLPILQMHIVK